MELYRILNEFTIKKYEKKIRFFTLAVTNMLNDKVFKQAKHILHSTKHTVRFLSTNTTRTISDCRK